MTSKPAVETAAVQTDLTEAAVRMMSLRGTVPEIALAEAQRWACCACADTIADASGTLCLAGRLGTSTGVAVLVHERCRDLAMGLPRLADVPAVLNHAIPATLDDQLAAVARAAAARAGALAHALPHDWLFDCLTMGTRDTVESLTNQPDQARVADRAEALTLCGTAPEITLAEAQDWDCCACGRTIADYSWVLALSTERLDLPRNYPSTPVLVHEPCRGLAMGLPALADVPDVLERGGTTIGADVNANRAARARAGAHAHARNDVIAEWKAIKGAAAFQKPADTRE